jgi:hypothetical protein
MIDTHCARIVLTRTQHFRNASIFKLKYILESDEISTQIRTDHHEFFSYMRDTFTDDINKKYFTKSKNTKYNIFILKMAVKLFIMYQKSLAYTYRPGGPAYIEAQENFYRMAGILTTLKETCNHSQLISIM